MKISWSITTTASGEEKKVEVDFQEKDLLSDPLLDLVEKSGLELSYGCRSGSCGSCFVEVLNGENYFQSPDPLEAETLEQMKDHVDSHFHGKKGRLSCRAKLATCSVGPIEIKLRQ